MEGPPVRFHVCLAQSTGYEVPGQGGNIGPKHTDERYVRLLGKIMQNLDFGLGHLRSSRTLGSLFMARSCASSDSGSNGPLEGQGTW